ncbi:hypothetical protein [Streptomyces sp. bgisy153]|uniref:phage tail tube protein n=1 Tax=Streptomyces sp. bgisy153 TaxID=3413793 RepID=UPI003D733C7F
MSLNATEVRVGGGASSRIYRGDAPGVLPAPTGPTDPLNAGYVDLGYASDDGLKETHDDSTDTIVAWQGATVVRSTLTSSVLKYELKLIQTRGSTLETFHRGSVVTEPTAGIFKLEVKPPKVDLRSWVFDVFDGDVPIRIYLGNAEVTSRGDVMYANGDAIGYPLTITAYPDANGDLAVKWSNDAAWGLDLISGS